MKFPAAQLPRLRRKRPHFQPPARVRALAFAATMGLVLCPTSASFAQDGGGEYARSSQVDRFEWTARSRLTVAGFQRALLPGPGGAIVMTDTLAPFHEALSVSAARIDTPFEKDSLDVQVAVYGQASAGQTEGMPAATWDVSSAFLTQRYGGLSFSLGRQPVVGGAARYRRLDGVVVRGRTNFGAVASAYYGLTVLPRWDQWYGTHYLGDAYEQWSSAPSSIVTPVRDENWMGGMSLGWANERIGSATLTFHHQSENRSLADQSAGLSVRLGGWSPVGLLADAIYSLTQLRWSDVRLVLDWTLARDKESGLGLGVRGEVLHTLPAALLSQASVLSVFSFAEVTEAGGEVDIQLPLRMRVGLGGFGQDYGEGAPGARFRGSYQIVLGPTGRTLLRFVTSRVLMEQNGYVQLRGSGVFPLGARVTAYADIYQYFYDEPIRGHETSTFAAAHVGYTANKILSSRIGASASQSPNAALDLQVLGQVTLAWDQEVH